MLITKNKKASILIVISFIFLILLFITGLSLIYIGNIATKETTAYKDRIIAQFTAQSGINLAIADRIENAKKRLYDSHKDAWYFKREEYVDNNLNGYYDMQDTFIHETDQNGNGTYDTYLSSEETLNPSYKSNAGGVLIYLPNNEITIQPPSGFLPSYKNKWLQFYKTKIIDNASGILINYPIKKGSKFEELTDSVVNLLNNLGEVVIVPQLNKKINEVHQLKLGDRIKEIRKLGPIKFKEELTYDKYGAYKFSYNEFISIKDFISVSMWRDPRTYLISSIPKYLPREFEKSKKQANLPVIQYPNWRNQFKKSIICDLKSSNFKFQFLNIPVSFFGICPGPILGRGAEDADNLTKYSDHLNNNYGAEDQPRPQKTNLYFFPEIEFEMRAPININTAPKEVLIAMFLNLQAYYYDKSEKTYVNPGKLKLSEPIDMRKSILLAYHIIAYRKQNIIRNFNDFKDLILGKKFLYEFDLKYVNKDIIDTTFSFLTDIDKKVILANVDPESHIYDFNPDSNIGVIFDDISKYNLTFNTTEITFFSHGYYEIESTGFLVREFEDTEKDRRHRELEKLYIGMLKSNKSSSPYIRSQVFIEKNHYNEKFHKVLAIEKVVSNVSLYETVKISSQADFVNNLPIFQGDNVYTVTIPREKVAIKGVELYPENLNSLLSLVGDYSKAATYEGYITLKPQTIPIWKNEKDSIVFQTDLEKSYKAQKGFSFGGTAYSARSILDMWDEKNRMSIDNGITLPPLEYTKSSLLPDGFFIHETKRVGYEYCNDKEIGIKNVEQACKYGYISNPTKNYESYLYYKTFSKGKFIFPKKGYLEMWFKPAWNREDQEIGWEGSDTRTFFSMGDSRGIVSNNQEIIITEKRQVGLLDPEEVAQAITANIPNISRIIVEMPPNINEILSIMRQRFAKGLTTQKDLALPKAEYKISYSIVVNSRAEVAPLERFAFFARNRELALFIGNNFSTFSGVDTFGNLRKTSVPLLDNWKAGTWHHIAFKWYGPNKNVRVFLDGKASTNAYKPNFVFSNVNSMFFGSNRFKENKCNGFPLNADGTIASIRIYDNPNIVSSGGFAIPDRYNPSASIKKMNAYIESVLLPKTISRRFANHKLFGIVLNGSINELLSVDLENQYGGFCIDLIVSNVIYENIACFGKFFRNPIPEVAISGEKESRYTPPLYKADSEEYTNLSYSKGWVSTEYLKLPEVGANEVKYRIKFESPLTFPLLTTPVLDSAIFLFLRNPIISTNTNPLPGKF